MRHRREGGCFLCWLVGYGRSAPQATSQERRLAPPVNGELFFFPFLEETKEMTKKERGLSVVELVLLELSGLWAVEQPHSSAQWKQANTSNSTNNSLSLYSFFSLLSNNSNPFNELKETFIELDLLCLFCFIVGGLQAARLSPQANSFHKLKAFVSFMPFGLIN